VISADLTGSKKVLGEESAKLLTFTWSIPNADIISGQGTREILADVTGQRTTGAHVISVTVHVAGLPPECNSRITRDLTVDPNCVEPTKFDEYGDITFDLERSRLDLLANRLRNIGRDSVAYIVVYAGKKECASEAELRANRAKRYLVQQKLVPEDQVEPVDGGFRPNVAVELFLSKCSCGPLPRSTVPMDEVEISGPCFDKYESKTHKLLAEQDTQRK
jgi:hypothetical protein